MFLQGWTQKVTVLTKSPSATASDRPLTSDMQTTPSSGDSRGREPQEISFLVLEEEKAHVSVTEPQEHVTPKLLLGLHENDIHPLEENVNNIYEYSEHETVGEECMGYLNPVFEDLLDQDEVTKTGDEERSKPLVDDTPEKPEELMESEPPVEGVRQYPEIVSEDVQLRQIESAVPDVLRTAELSETDEITVKKQEETEECNSVGNITETKVSVEMGCGDDVKTVKSSAQASEDADDMDTFCLAKDSMLFSQVSTNTLVTSTAEVDHVGSQQEADPCQVVEVKAIEIVKSVVTPVEPIEHVVYPSRSMETMEQFGPLSVEMVEIFDEAETEPEESAPETDTESPVKLTDVQGDRRKRPSTLKLHDVDTDVEQHQEEDFDTVISNKKIARLSPSKDGPPLSQRLSDEEIIRVSAVAATSDPAACLNVTQLLTESVGKLSQSPPKVSIPGYCVEVHATPTPPPTPAMYPSDILSSLCLQMTDRVNKTEETTVTAWRDSEFLTLDDTTNTHKSHVGNGVEIVGRTAQYAVTEGGQRYEHSKSPDLKEVVLKKEIEVSKTYKIIGNISDPDPSCNTATVVLRDISPVLDDDYNSFYGSDKETDDVVEFSDDGGPPLELNDSSSSDDESPSLGHLVMQHFDKVGTIERKCGIRQSKNNFIVIKI